MTARLRTCPGFAAAAKALAVLSGLAMSQPCLAAPHPEASAERRPVFRVGTFNIRCETGKDTGERSWKHRRNDVASLIRRMKCDVIGLQEVTPGQMKFLRGELGEYAFTGDFRNKDRRSGEAAPVCYLRSRFDLVRSGTFWLSSDPDRPGSRNWGAAFPRNCAWALLKDRGSGRLLLFACTHPDHKSADARLNGLKVVSRRLQKECDGAPIVLVGDHNCTDGEPPARYLRSVFADGMYVTKTPPRGPWRSFSGWAVRDVEIPAVDALKMPSAGREASHSIRIDYIYVTPGSVVVLAYGTVALKRSGREEYFSDHFPVIAQIRLR